MDYTKMTLREKVLQTFCTCSYYIQKEESIAAFFEKYPVGAMYFAKSQVEGLAPLMEGGIISDTALIDECRAASKYPLLVCADGANIGKDGKGGASAVALGAAHNVALAEDYGRALGMQMNYNHIDWILGPCIDMALCHTTDLVSAAATDDADWNAEMFSAVCRGIRAEGVIPTVKHFPGLGTHPINFHYGPGQNVLDFDTWMDTYGKSYLACFAAGALSVMTSHLTFRAFSEKGDDGYYPIATYSTDLTVRLLKEKLGFRGIVVTDALIMGGMATGNQTEEAVQAFKSGADILLWPPMEAADRIVEEIEAGRIPMSRLEDALSRIAYVREQIGAMHATRAFGEADTAFVDTTITRIAEEGIACIANEEGILPLSPARHRRVLVAGCATDEAQMKKLRPLAEALTARGFEVTFQEYLLICWQDQMDALQEKYDLIIATYHCPIMVGAFANCASSCWSAHLLDKKKSMFLNFGSPHFADDYFPEARTFVNVHSAPGEDSIRAAVECLCGERPFLGTSPVVLAR